MGFVGSTSSVPKVLVPISCTAIGLWDFYFFFKFNGLKILWHRRIRGFGTKDPASICMKIFNVVSHLYREGPVEVVVPARRKRNTTIICKKKSYESTYARSCVEF